MNLTGTDLAAARQGCDRLAGMTIPQLLLERVREAPSRTAIRYKDAGIFRELTWARYAQRVRDVAAGLVGLGVKAGDRFCVMGNPCVEYVLFHLGAHFAGAVPFGIYPTSSAEEVVNHLAVSGAKVCVVETQEHLDKMLLAEERARRRLLDLIILVDDRALFLYEDRRIRVARNVEADGHGNASSQAEVDRRAAAQRPESPAELTFTSGTTGVAKGACHSHADLMVGMGYGYLEGFPELRQQRHRVICHLPLAHLVERTMTVFVPLIADVVPHLGERQQTLLSLLAEVKPTYFHAVPRIWEKIAAHVAVNVEMSHRIGRKAFEWAERTGRTRLERIWNDPDHRAGLRAEALYRLAWLTVYWPALYKVGLCYAMGGVSGGAPLPPRIQETWQSWGLPLRNFYGSTEASVVGSQQGPWPKPDAPMLAVYPKQIRRAPDGELLITGAGLLSSYWNDPDATRATFGTDGWLKSGDVVDGGGDGLFRIVDRKKDIIITSGGKNIAPAQVENVLKASPYISEAIVFGEQKAFVTALIEIDFESVAHWARNEDIPYTGYTSLAKNPKVHGLIDGEVRRANDQLARPEQVKKFRVLVKELDPEDGDTTPTRKVKRQHAYKLFGHLVDEMYEDKREAA
ncbi:MAG: long-chain fatty acid--CoA ligase [Lautropia sp.]